MIADQTEDTRGTAVLGFGTFVVMFVLVIRYPWWAPIIVVACTTATYEATAWIRRRSAKKSQETAT